MLIRPEDDLEFQDGENFQYTEKGEITHEQLILQAMKRCMEEGSKEMRGGYTKETVDRNGQIKETYVEDQRQVYMQSIQALQDIMIPKYDSKIRKQIEDFDEELKQLKTRAINILKEKLKIIEDKEQKEQTQYPQIKFELQQQIITELIDPDSYEAKIILDGTIKAYRKLYQNLIECYSRKGFGSEEAIDDAKT